MSQTGNYSAKRLNVDGIEVIRLTDAAHSTEVSVMPSVGNMAYEMKVKGANVFWWPYANLTQFKEKPGFAGNPFLGPWANRLDEDAFYAGGKRYALNPALGNVRRDQFQHPIHGFLSYVPWDVVEVRSDASGAAVTSRLEFWKHPDWMAQFPFAQRLTMTYTLSEGVLETRLLIENLSTDPLPVSVGFHPYFQVHDAPRDEWTAHIAAREHVLLSKELVPTGEREPSKLADPFPLAGGQLDDVFTALDRDANGRAVFWVRGRQQKVSVVYGPKYAVAVVYAPPGRPFICFEPMVAVTNAMNLAHRGLYAALPYIPAGGRWEESFWVRPEGF